MYEGNRSRARVIKLLGFQLLTIQLRTIIISSMFLQRHVIDRYLIDHNERWRYYPLVGIMIRVDLLHNSITAQPPSNTHINTISARQPSNRQAQFDKKHDKNCNSFDDPIIILCTLNSSISICLLLSAALLLSRYMNGLWTKSVSQPAELSLHDKQRECSPLPPNSPTQSPQPTDHHPLPIIPLTQVKSRPLGYIERNLSIYQSHAESLN